MHGDAFFRLFSEKPISDGFHDPEIQEGSTTFTITANDSADIALTVIMSSSLPDWAVPADPWSLPFRLNAGTMVLVTVTKQNSYRYQDNVR